MIIRPIQPSDNSAIAKIIRSSLEEFGANKPGTAYFDEATDHLFEEHNISRSKYFIAEYNGVIMGGCGIYPSPNLPANICELVKLYLRPAARGKGIGKLLMEQCFNAAIVEDFNKIYLETLPDLDMAVGLYEKMGFQYLPAALGNSGHDACTIWMIKTLQV